ncbi:hypothetical protein [Oryzobacter terrae]|uniref:hypothetical protein n=1 Tax=Oryzobacter terrae TaxID=1620385 RepID=UPI00366E0B2D
MTSSTASRTAASSYRYALLLAMATALFLVLGAGALGVIGDGRADRWYLVVIGVLAIGSVVARFRARAMAVVLLATAVAQVLVPVGVLAAGTSATGSVSVLDVAGLTAMYAGLFALSSWLFHRAGRARPALARRSPA